MIPLVTKTNVFSTAVVIEVSVNRPTISKVRNLYIAKGFTLGVKRNKPDRGIPGSSVVAIRSGCIH